MRQTIMTMIAASIIFLDGWRAPIAFLLVIVIHWDYFGRSAGEAAELYLTRHVLSRLSDDLHANVDARMVLLAVEMKGR